MLHDKIQAIVNPRSSTTRTIPRALTGDPKAIPGTVEYEANLKAIREKYGIQNSAAAVPVAVETLPTSPTSGSIVSRVFSNKWAWLAAGVIGAWLVWGRKKHG